MNFTSVSGKKWIFKNFSDADVKDYSEKYFLSEIVSKLIEIISTALLSSNVFSMIFFILRILSIKD